MSSSDTAICTHASVRDESARRVSSIVLRAADAPGRVALIADGKQVSYRELAALIRTACATLEQAGVRAADRVAILGLNTVDAVAFILAAQDLGAWAAILNPRLSAAEIDANVALVEPRALVFIHEQCDEARVHAQRFDARPLAQFAAVLLAPGAANPSGDPPDAGDPGALLFTSGVTGKPRAVMLSGAALLAMGEATVQNGEFREGDVAYAIAPFAHVIGLGTVLMGTLCAGATIELVARFDVANLAAAVCTGRITRLIAVPLIYSRLIEHLEAHRLDCSAHRLRMLAVGGAPLDPTLKARVEQRFGVGLINGYGCTEISPIARSNAAAGDPAHAGKPFGGAQLRVVLNGLDAPEGEVGEIWARGPTLMSGYFRDPQATAAAMRPGGWLATGDLGRRDAVGNLHVVGRMKELIIRSGFNVYPAEVEAALNAHPAVRQSAVVPRTVADGNEEIIAFVQVDPQAPVSPEEIRAFAAERLAPYKKPARILALPHLPVGPTGKIDKQELRRVAQSL